ncbi:MAG: iron-containing alcohol dehydrogenase [Spirochaetes bacterium]|nr:iron-containing alcohol dehydrogenase [Spirochaetota bacterium]
MNDGVFPDFHIPTEIFIKQDVISDIGKITRKFGTKVLIITTSEDFIKYSSILENITQTLNNNNIGCIVYDEIPENPDTEYVDSAVYYSKMTRCDVIIGFGGIDSINSAKAVALLANNNLFCSELFDDPKVLPPIPLILIPTLPLFGFELLPIFFVTQIKEKIKKVYRNNYIFPEAVVVDPRISATSNEEETADSTISILAIAVESVVSKKINDFVNTYALKSIDIIFKTLPLSFRDPANIAHRIKLSTASIMSGIAFATTELSMSLSISLALSSIFHIPVAKGMGLMLPHVMEYNLTSSSGKYVQMSKVMDEELKDITVIEAAIKAVEGVRKLEIDVDIPQRLYQFDIAKNEFPRVAEIALSYPFTANAPRVLTKDEIETILIAAY